MRDGHIGHRPARKQRLPHGAGHRTVAPAHAIGMAAGPQGQGAHAHGLVGVAGIDPPHGQKLLAVAHQIGNAPQHCQHLMALVSLVAGRHRGVGGEHHLLAHSGPGVIDPALGPCLEHQLKHPQRRVPLVQVVCGWRNAQCAQGPHAPNTQHGVLGQPDRPTALIQARGHPAPDLAVLRQIGVQQIQRHPAHIHPPDLHRHVLIVNRHAHGHGASVPARHPDAGQPLGVRIQPVFILITRHINALVKVTGAVHQAQANQGQRQVRRFFENVTRENAQAT